MLSTFMYCAACDGDSDGKTPNYDYHPKPTDASLTRGPVYIDSTGILIRESDPPQFSLEISGTLPTPCHVWRAVVATPNRNNIIDMDVYSLVDPDVICIQVLEAFSGTIDIPTPPPGKYTVRVNGKAAGSFEY